MKEAATVCRSKDLCVEPEKLVGFGRVGNAKASMKNVELEHQYLSLAMAHTPLEDWWVVKFD
jgi:hypothetical protein